MCDISIMLNKWAKPFFICFIVAVVGFIYLQQIKTTQATVVDPPKPLPEFTHTKPELWLNSAPLTKKQLEGKVILVDFWTFACWNCYRSFPWLNDLESRLESKGLQVIGVHSPEFERERVKKNIEEKIKEFKLKHPVMIDNDFSYWKALNNRYWPAFYLVDKKGFIRATFAGETHKGTARAEEIEKLINKLLAE